MERPDGGHIGDTPDERSSHRHHRRLFLKRELATLQQYGCSLLASTLDECPCTGMVIVVHGDEAHQVAAALLALGYKMPEPLYESDHEALDHGWQL